ncbi:urate hydroxylase PuuD [Pigmentiphaga sp.]|jgi:Predicted membrane protein|uniref:urate hydroxylase PuuD n=1 Tax=Pigmentiphaga sp. TaxID=1977564 RepID=UPI0025E619D7|nr:urate hydroxylase PuuD [Pigmentiphaga sp.]MBX6316818.1 urate hydroxylase PuuD [Pigmentiphaga sp.]
MEAYILDWANLLLRWLHVITAIAWIGSSFYFVWLDNSLLKPQDPELLEKGVSGELWAVHGGGFYNPQKYLVAPKQLPEHLHWFYWESYSTWMSGFALLVVLYLFNARTYLIDPNVFNWGPAAAVVAALCFLVVGWLVYDAICRIAGTGERADRTVGIAVAVFVAAAAWLACHLFAGRAAFLIVGAMIATIMSANVLMVIIPGQRKVVAAMRAGEPVDPIHGQLGKQRSVHNTYFTLPVLFAMLSNHYSMVYSAKYNWLVLIAIMLAGALIRQFFVLRHKQVYNFWYPAAGVALLAAVAWSLAPSGAGTGAAAFHEPLEPQDITQVQQVVAQRCVVCHNAQLPNKGIQLQTPELLKSHAQVVYQQAVVQRTMPLNNATAMTEEERALLGRWFQAGAPLAASR